MHGIENVQKVWFTGSNISNFYVTFVFKRIMVNKSIANEGIPVIFMMIWVWFFTCEKNVYFYHILLDKKLCFQFHRKIFFCDTVK